MSMTGAIVNALAIVAGGAVGLLFRRGIPERVSKTVMIGLGLCVLYIGISGAMECRSILIVIVSMSLGAAVGALLNIDGAIHRLGTWVETHFHRHEGGHCQDVSGPVPAVRHRADVPAAGHAVFQAARCA